MQIIVDGKEVAIKRGSSFEYISENRLFSGSDAYTLEITLPLRDCPVNVDVFGNINRADVLLRKVRFDCEIRDRGFYKFGTATVVEISETEVKCQFLEGRSEANFDNNFDKVFVDELDLGGPAVTDKRDISPAEAINPNLTGYKCVALPWVNNSTESGMEHNFMNTVLVGDSPFVGYEWADMEERLSWQPYLVYIIRSICSALGYGYDIAILEKDSRFRNLIVCNTLPPSWDKRGFASALPHWTVEEFFSKLELFLGGEFSIDHRTQNISFAFIGDILASAREVCLENVVDEFSVGVDGDDGKCEYLELKNLSYAGGDSDVWKFYSCDWFIEKNKGNVVEYATMKEMVDGNAGLRTIDSVPKNFSGMRNNLSRVLYVREADCYFILVAAGKHFTSQVGDTTVYKYYFNFIPVNMFGDRFGAAESEEADREELEFLPVEVDYVVDDPDVIGDELNRAFFIEVGSDGSDVKEGDDAPGYTGPQMDILEGEAKKGGQYFDKVYLGWWDGMIRDRNRMPYPMVWDAFVSSDWKIYEASIPIPFRLRGARSMHEPCHIIDPKVKYTFKFLADSIPDARAVFFIRGKRYVCEKITATFTERGMSQLLKGEFYQLID